MSDPTTDQQPGTPPAEAQNTDRAEPMIPKSRFDEINTKLRRLEAEAAQREQAQREQAEREAAAKGEYEKLATERGQRLSQVEQEAKSVAEQRDAYAAEMERQIKERARRLPDELRDLLPEGDTLTRFTHLAKLEAAAAKLGAQKTPGTPPGPRGSGSDAPPPAGVDMRASKLATIDYSN